MQRNGFTLWELLGVIVIILVIAAFLFPFSVCGCANGKVRQIACLSNEKQLMLGVLMYSQDNDQAIPDIATAPGSNQTWRRLILPYVKSEGLFLCPSRRNKNNGPDGLPRSYAANDCGNYHGGKSDRGKGAFAGPGSKPLRTADFTNPAGLIAICEFAGGNTPEFNIDNSVRFGPGKRLLWAGHWHGGNYGFADGHAKYQRPEQTQDEWHRDSKIPLSANGLAVLAETAKRAGK